MRKGTAMTLALAAGAGAVMGLQVAGRISGSTRKERRRALPGDDLIPRPGLVTNHGATLAAPPEDVWPWLTQLGWHRGGWYTPEWVDRLLFPGNLPSARSLDASLLRDLEPGDTIPDGPPGTAQFVVRIAQAPNLLVLHSTTHLPADWRTRFGASLDWLWTFSLDPVPSGTRLLIRNRGVVRPWWVNVAYQALLVPADHVMATGMLRGLRERVSTAANTPA
jgi:hypothetical protein